MAQTQKSSAGNIDLPKSHDHDTVVLTNKKATPLKGGNSMKIVCMWNLEHEIRSQMFYEILNKIKLKGYTDLDLNNLYVHIKMCLNAMTRLREDLLTSYQYIKRHSWFEKYSFHIYITLIIIVIHKPTVPYDTYFDYT